MDDSALSLVWQKQSRGEPLTADERKLRSQYNTGRAKNSTRVYWENAEEKARVQGHRKAAGYRQDSAFVRDLVLNHIDHGFVDPELVARLEAENKELREDLGRWKEMHNEVAAENRELGLLNRELQQRISDVVGDVLREHRDLGRSHE